MRNIFQYKIKGYFTVEASFILPVVIMLFTFLLWLSFFLYNKCIFSQDIYLTAFRGNALCLSDISEKENFMKQKKEQQFGTKYFGIEKIMTDVRADSDSTLVEGQFKMKLTGWNYKIERTASDQCPVEFIRKIRLAQKVLEGAEP